MSRSSTADAQQSSPALAPLAVAALEALGFAVEPPAADGTRQVRPAAATRRAPSALPVPEYQGRTSFAFSDDDPQANAEQLAADAPLWRWILEQLHARKQLLSAAPLGEPQAVHEFSGRLLSAYQVDGGTVHLAGCYLQPLAFVRVLRFDERGQVEDQIIPPRSFQEAENFAALRNQLHLNDWHFADPPRSVSLREQADVYQAAVADAASVRSSPAEQDDLPPLLVAEWCHRATGKLEFEIGEAAFTVPFDDWARNLKPPPIACPVTGEATYHLAKTDDGRLIAAEQLAACRVCQQKLPRSELAASAVSGAMACQQHAVHCPISGDAVLEEELVECPSTSLSVAPSAVRHGQSTLLDDLEPVDASETTLARLRLDHPALDSYAGWKLARGAEVDIYIGSKLTSRVMAVVNRDTGELLHAAQKTKLARSWKPLELSNPRE